MKHTTLILVVLVVFAAAETPFTRLRSRLLDVKPENHEDHRGGRHGSGWYVEKMCDYVIVQDPTVVRSVCVLFGQTLKQNCRSQFEAQGVDDPSERWPKRFKCFRDGMYSEFPIDWTLYEQDHREKKVARVCEFIEAQQVDNKEFDSPVCVEQSLAILNKCLEDETQNFMTCGKQLRAQILPQYGAVDMNEMSEEVANVWALNSCRNHPGDDDEKAECSVDILDMLANCKEISVDKDIPKDLLNGFVRRCVRKGIEHAHDDGGERHGRHGRHGRGRMDEQDQGDEMPQVLHGKVPHLGM